MKRSLIIGVIAALLSIIVTSVEAKIWTKDLVDKVILDSGYKLSLCSIDMAVNVDEVKDAGFLLEKEKEFAANPGAYPCNKDRREDILFANITLNFSQANWGGGSAHEKIIQFQDKLYSVDAYGSIFTPDFTDTKQAYADLGGVDWFSTTPGLHAVRGGNLIETNPEAKGAFVPNSTFLVIHDPATGAFTSALFIFNNTVYKLDEVTNKVTAQTVLVDYTSPSDNLSATPSPTLEP